MKLRVWQSTAVTAILAVTFLSAVFAIRALRPEFKAHGLFTDNMLLQRDRKIPVWGSSDLNDPVAVTFGDQTVFATPVHGKWMTELAPMAASAEPRDLVIRQGTRTLIKKNVLVGDVWLCGGQSNMQMEVQQSAEASEALASATNPRIRLFTVQRQGDPLPRSDLKKGGWSEATPELVGKFSAVGYYFGRDLQKAVDVPVGLISCNFGATAAERWMSQEAIDVNPEIQEMTSPQGRHDLYNAMVAPLAPFGLKGAIWYQGESNADRPYTYRHLLAGMIKCWRDTFGQGDFPFLIVELAPFTTIVDDPVDQEWAVVRESMQWVAKHVPNVETVSIVDLGDEHDIHPRKKQTVGERLARAARALAYGEAVVPAGPKFNRVTFQGNEAIIKFRNVGAGLEIKDWDGLPAAQAGGTSAVAMHLCNHPDAVARGFTIAGHDRKFHRACARIDGDTVVVSSEQVASPQAVRFGWANYPVINLWNRDGQPASPFRTDNWPVVKQGLK